jgi:16S rRNA G527 N7-methylase RsmG
MSKLLEVFQNSGSLIAERKLDRSLGLDSTKYNMTPRNGSTFIDIGSGFGLPVFHSAIQTACKSYGVEIVVSRVSFAED